MNAGTLYRANVMHARLLPKRRIFRYRVFTVLLDIDQLDVIHHSTAVLSVNRFNLFSFHEVDHGPGDGSSLRDWADALLAEHRIDCRGGSISLLCFPRVLGYAFNPLSLWYCSDRNGELRAVIHEVRNTFGERHFYVVRSEGATGIESGAWHAAEKVFHVSPFLPLAMQYRFRIVPPAAALDVLIDTRDADGERFLLARMSGVALPFTTRSLLNCFLSCPFMTLKVIAMIHWQALLLLLKGFPFHRKPPAPARNVSTAWPLNTR